MAVVTEAKTLLEALENAKNQLGTEKIVYKQEEITSGKIFKTKLIKVHAISTQELLDLCKTYLKEVLTNLGLKELQFETSMNENESFTITMYSDNNPILIGKNGQTLKALETLLKIKLNNTWGVTPKISLDVENYKEKRIASLEKLAIHVASEVRRTKIDASLDNMNSYERRIIHNKLTNFKGVTTASEGEEPNRHIVIHYTKD